MSGSGVVRPFTLIVAALLVVLAWLVLRLVTDDFRTVPGAGAGTPAQVVTVPLKAKPPTRKFPVDTYDWVAGDEDRTGAIDIRVVDVDEEPVAGASVGLYPFDGATFDLGEPSETLATDAEGSVRFVHVPPRMYRVHVEHGSLASLAIPINVPESRRRSTTLRVEPARVIHGRVLLPDGSPGAGAFVQVELVYSGSRTFTRAGGAGEDGVIRLHAFPLSGLVGAHLRSSDADGPRVSVELDPATVTSVAGFELTLRPFSIVGRCVDGGGAPLPGVRVRTVRGQMAQAPETTHGTTDARGRFTLVPRRVAPVNLVLEQKGLARRVLYDIEHASGEVDIGDVVMTSGTALLGTVVSTAGAPVATAHVTLEVRHCREALATTTTDRFGRYSFPSVSADPQAIHVAAGAMLSRGGELRHLEPEARTLNVVLDDPDQSYFWFEPNFEASDIAVFVHARGSDEPFFEATLRRAPANVFTWVPFRVPPSGAFEIRIRAPGFDPLDLSSGGARRHWSLGDKLRKAE